MPTTTITYMIMTAAILGLVIALTPLAVMFTAAQHLPAVHVELRNIAFMVEEQMIITCEAAKSAQSPVQTRINMPSDVFGSSYIIFISGTTNTLIAQSGQNKFTTNLPVGPGLPNVIWQSSTYQGGTTRLLVNASYDSSIVTVSISN